MEQIDVLCQNLERKKGLAVLATVQKTFTVTYAPPGASGDTSRQPQITIEFVHPNFIHFESESGTPSDAFEIDQPRGDQSATFSSVTTGKSFASASLLADHLETLLKSLSEQTANA